MKGVVVEDYFPDRRLFIESVQAILRRTDGGRFRQGLVFLIMRSVQLCRTAVQMIICLWVVILTAQRMMLWTGTTLSPHTSSKRECVIVPVGFFGSQFGSGHCFHCKFETPKALIGILTPPPEL
ncbi:hypothetical protein NFI96_026384 [Prochilodus magdalenae]|nr:hypothetical protein NFI96_026384 [Prochilodus magdalenae]